MSVRADKVSAEIRRNLSAIFARLKSLDLPGMVSILRVDTDSDLIRSKVFISVYPDSDLKRAVKLLTENKGIIKKELASAMRSMRSLPDLIFLADDSLEYGEKINRILEKIKNDETQS